MLIWEEYGMTLEEYAEAFNKATDEAFGEEPGEVCGVNLVLDRPRACGVIEMNEEQF